MPTKFKDYPIYTYDEPATYDKFTGGINSDPASENLEDTELRDCLNMHYSSASLVKRKGAKLLCTISCEDELYNVQGTFLFTYRLTYIIIAADGKLYQGVYNENINVKLTRLHIYADVPYTGEAYNPLNMFVGLERYHEEQRNIKHEGFLINYAKTVIRYYDYQGVKLQGYTLPAGIYAKDAAGDILYSHPDTKNMVTRQELIEQGIDWTRCSLYAIPTSAKFLSSHVTTAPYNYVGQLQDIDLELLQIDDVIDWQGQKYQLYSTHDSSSYMRVERLDTTNDDYWIELSEYNAMFVDEIHERTDFVSYRIQRGDSITGIYRKPATGSSFACIAVNTDNPPPMFEFTDSIWEEGDAVRDAEGTVFICRQRHYSFTEHPSNSNNFVPIVEVQELIFQNHRKIQAATYDNKLYIATGTRFTVVSLTNNELTATIVTPYKINNSESVAIGYNHLSPYPEYCRETLKDTATTSISNVLVVKQNGGVFTLIPQMTFAMDESPSDYYYKWEKKIQVGNEEKWYTIISFKQAVESKKLSGANFYQIEVDDADKYLYRVTFAKTFEGEMNAQAEWEAGKEYKVGDYVQINMTTLYQCVTAHTSTSEFIEFIPEVRKQRYRVLRRLGPDPLTTPVAVMDANNTTAVIIAALDEKELREKLAPYTEKDVPGTQHTYADMALGSYEVQEQVVQWKRIYEEEEIDVYVKEDALYSELLSILKTTSSTKIQASTYTDWSFYSSTEPRVFTINETVNVGTSLYRCITDHTSSEDIYADEKWVASYINSEGEEILLWEKYHEINTEAYGTSTDYTVDKVSGDYFGSATTILHRDPSDVDDTFKTIQSCTKIIREGNKFLLYGDRYNSGSWYKTVLDNPAYIANRGGLSFKTTKNEELVSVVLFQGNIIAFANADNTGGSIHLVTGSGDDYSQDEYYSPYRKRVINQTISCNNADTIQVAENILIFKYFDMLYYINASDLNNEVITVYSCNDRIKQHSKEVQVPWEDNDCVSEITQDYYALIWKEKHYIEGDDLVQERPAIRLKMYYKMPYQIDNKYYFPWLRDESDYFNVQHILYIKGKSIFLYNNTLLTFNENVYSDLDKDYECLVHFKGVDINYPKLWKLISNITVYYHRNQYTSIDFDLYVRNEAGHILYDSKHKKLSIQDLRALKAGDTIEDGGVRLDSTITDVKVFNTTHKFPCLLADTMIKSKSNKEFSISSITYNYTTIETPDQTPYDVYSSIIRPQEVRNDK